MSAEGQADSYSTHVCPRVIWKGQDAKNAVRAWNSTTDRNLCYRVMKASEALAAVDASLGNTVISWATPDPTRVETTQHSYPSGQCRLDNYAAGAACFKSWNHQTGNVIHSDIAPAAGSSPSFFRKIPLQ